MCVSQVPGGACRRGFFVYSTIVFSVVGTLAAEPRQPCRALGIGGAFPRLSFWDLRDLCPSLQRLVLDCLRRQAAHIRRPGHTAAPRPDEGGHLIRGGART